MTTMAKIMAQQASSQPPMARSAGRPVGTGDGVGIVPAAINGASISFRAAADRLRVGGAAGRRAAAAF
jgi:hypothetical protein